MKKYIALKEYFKKIYHYRKYDIFDTEHSVARYKERIGKDIGIYQELLEDAIDWIVKNKKESTEDRYIFISKKHNFGIQIHWREKRENKEFAGFSATTLSKNEMEFEKYEDKKVFLENMVKQGRELKEAKKNVNKYFYMYNFSGELKEEMDLCCYDIFIEEGKVYKTFEVVEL